MFSKKCNCCNRLNTRASSQFIGHMEGLDYYNCECRSTFVVRRETEITLALGFFLALGILLSGPAHGGELKKRLFNICDTHLIGDDPDQFTITAQKCTDSHLLHQIDVHSAVLTKFKTDEDDGLDLSWNELRIQRWTERMLSAAMKEAKKRGLK